MTGWRGLEAAVDRRIGLAFGETVRLSFLKGGVVDPARPAVDIRAVLHVGGDDSKPVGDSADRYRSRLSLGEAELFIDRTAYSGPMPRQGDGVRASDRAGQPWFEVAGVSDRYSNLIVLTLGAK
ncbi:hypothetical protein [Kaistia nematophila]|uniref:Uncharacterized protein n=1 Tax=Kaistia nematophila TaxID=2994654 RepID=A0A9X3E5G9_9HYPH|nr:hypothetical protein [Kaistia nematophila]MCX5571478.1 hypothetical protein [Kaistia nematophila]